MEYVTDSSQIDGFFLDKVSRFNTCMGRINLHYYFEWFWQCRDKHIEVERVMKSEFPPDEFWYRKNYYFINCHTIQGLSYKPMSFCSHGTQHDRHWHIIRMIYDWVIMYKRKGSDKYYKDVENFLNRVQDIIRINEETSMTDAETQIAITKLIESFNSSPDDRDDILTHHSHYIIEARVLGNLRRMYETIQMHSTRRWKLHNDPSFSKFNIRKVEMKFVMSDQMNPHYSLDSLGFWYHESYHEPRILYSSHKFMGIYVIFPNNSNNNCRDITVYFCCI